MALQHCERVLRVSQAPPSCPPRMEARCSDVDPVPSADVNLTYRSGVKYFESFSNYKVKGGERVHVSFRAANSRRTGARLLAGDARGLLRGGLAFVDAAVAPLAFLKFHQRFQQPRAVEIGPQRVGHENLRVSNLPEKEIAHTHLTARA